MTMGLGGLGPETDLLLSEPEGGVVYSEGSSFRLALRSFMENRLAIAGAVILVFFVLFSFVGPFVYHSNQSAGDLLQAHLPPRQGHPLGTDTSGFDELGRMMKGGQTALEIGLLSALIATVVGTLWGAIAGLAGGVVDGILMRIVDIGLSIPTLFIILILADRYNATVLSFALVIGLNQWLAPARLVRGEVLTLRVRDYVSAARAMGASRTRLISRHLIPNALGVVIVNVTFQIADAILYTSVVGFLGFGLNYPNVDWGDQLSDGVDQLLNGYWWLIYPVGACLILTVMAFNFIGDALRDAIDVRLRKR
ncbi:MAG TPA: ABC transporter permease [Mycobacteriales bacterium]|jgi:peptide/nickel transport system permease protein|nr:ABC transporter permease [Mycobacteriales bacterium]